MHRQHAGSASAAAVGLERVADLCDVLTLRSIPFVVGLIGEQPYRCDEVAGFVGAELVVPVAVDAWAAAVLAGRAGTASRLRRSGLLRSLAALARLLSTRLRETRQELTSHDSPAVGREDTLADPSAPRPTEASDG
jgi:hypothetical protein